MSSTLDLAAATPEAVTQTTDAALAAADAAMADAVAAGTLAELLVAYDRATGHLLDAAPASFLGHVHTDADVRAAGNQSEERLDQWHTERPFRDDLAAAVARLAHEAPTLADHDLGPELSRLYEFVQRALVRAGHGLEPDRRAEAQAAAARLVELSVQFQQHIAADDTSIDLTLDELDGMPPSFVEGLEPGAGDGTRRLTMAYPHVYPLLENATRRDVRERVHALFNTRAVDVNRPILDEAVALRQRMADLLGLESWAHYRMDHRMARSPDDVEAFYAALVDPLTTKSAAERAVMTDRLRADTGNDDDTLQIWDVRYYDNQIRKSDYGVDQFAVAEYFPLEQVLDGLLAITGEVFGLRYEPNDDPVWHDDVRSLDILDAADGRRLATVHMDLHPRPDKFGHAAAFTMIPGRAAPDGSFVAPVSAIVANFTKPTAQAPSLLTHDEVLTFFHEFGHILHQTLTAARLVEFAGTAVELDFVEAPSQIMEHWCWRPDVLARFARHHETGEAIPVELVNQLTAARDLNTATFQLRQMQFGVLDLGLHGPVRPDEAEADGRRDLDAILARATAVTGLDPQTGTFMPASFGHLFGYDAGYYGYMWSEVFGDDMFSRFAADGVLDPTVGSAYRRAILERGGTRDAEDMITEFLGRAPNQDAFLAKLGIAAADTTAS